MNWTPDATDLLAVNTLRALAIDAIEKANSGHPGLPLGAAPMAYTLWQRHLRFAPHDPSWPDRDRFILSPGHGSMLLYGLLHTFGFDLPMTEIENFRQWGSKAPGHPEYGVTPGVEATTGPLGQGTAVAVGMAIAERMLAHRFNREGHPVVDHQTYALVSDGDLMEGISSEAASLAGHLGLGKLIYLYDANDISLDGPTSLTFTEDVAARYRAYGWQVLTVADGNHDLAAIDAALAAARAETGKPSLIIVKTTIGFGSPNKGGTASSHGSPLGKAEAALTKAALGFPAEQAFFIPDQVRPRFTQAAAAGIAARKDWLARFDAYESAFPELAAEFRSRIAGHLAEDFDAALPQFTPESKGLATREASGLALNALAEPVPGLVGCDADLSCSCKTRLEKETDFEAAGGSGRNLRCGVREHSMGAIANGIAYHGGFRPFTSTFLAFADYMRGPIRLAALDRLSVVFVFTHDSLGVGEDGPTHQPVEQVTSLRAIPGLAVVRPADGNETMEAWRWALRRTAGPTALILSRQKLPHLAGTPDKAREGMIFGAYVLSETHGTGGQVALLASGSEVELALAAQQKLAEEEIGSRVISVPCQETFLAQEAGYQERVLPAALKARVAVEAGLGLTWHRFVGDAGRIISVERFGRSAPGPVVLEKFGITAERVVAAAKESLASTR